MRDTEDDLRSKCELKAMEQALMNSSKWQDDLNMQALKFQITDLKIQIDSAQQINKFQKSNSALEGKHVTVSFNPYQRIEDSEDDRNFRSKGSIF